MKEFTLYPQAPITEAIIDFQVQLPENSNLDQLLRVRDFTKTDYPVQQSLEQISGQIGQVVSLEKSHVGYQFSNADNKQVFRATLRGFSFHRLAPYSGWALFKNEAHRLWTIYKKSLTPFMIKRVSLRYVNHLNLPLQIDGSLNFQDYLTVVPPVPTSISQGVSSYLIQLLLPQPEIESMLMLNHAVVESPNPDFVSVVLDIEIYHEKDMDNGQQVWDILELCRNRKNQVFEECITDQTRELFK